MKPFPSLSRAAAFAILFAAWAAIYLPGLSAIEIKGEEIRRIMPGVNMLENHNWIVPEFNGEAYLRKPPLVNWAIAGSVKLFGVRNEITTRLPSVLAMLALGLTMLAACGPWLGTNAALAAALITLTSAGIVEKGRLAEIEAIYIALFGMAFSIWLGWTAAGRSKWLTWAVTGALLGLSLLAKGPPDLAYFYAIVGFIAWRVARSKDKALDPAFIDWAHLCGILIMVALAASWWIPYSMDPTSHGAGGVMARQLEQRIGGGAVSTIFVNFLRSLVNFLPWAIGLPILWREQLIERLNARDQIIVRGARCPIVVSAFAVMFIPGMLPRYTLPVVIPYALILAVLLKAWLGEAVLRWPLWAAGLAGAGMLLFGFLIGPRIADRQPARKFGAQINAKMPPGSAIYIFDPSVQPEIFYIDGKLIYTESVKTLPDEVPWLLAPDTALPLLRQAFRQCDILSQLRDPGGKPFSLVALHGHQIIAKKPKG